MTDTAEASIVVLTGAGGIDHDPVAQALPFDQQPEHPLGGGRTADIAETDEQHLDQGIPSQNVPLCHPLLAIRATVGLS